jgi:hypothetical protein
MIVTVAQADAQLRAMATPDRGQWDQLAVLFDTVEGAEAAAALLASDVADSVLWASMLVYQSAGADPEPLVPFLTDPRTPLRIAAAGGLLARGDVRGFEPLIAELEAGVTDPDAAWPGASRRLARWTGIGTFGPPLDGTADQRATGARQWRSWWTSNSNSLSFTDGRWTAA